MIKFVVDDDGSERLEPTEPARLGQQISKRFADLGHTPELPELRGETPRPMSLNQ